MELAPPILFPSVVLMIDLLPTFIGWDSREPECAEVCRSSLIRHTTIPLHVQYLKERALRHAGLYTRHWRTEATGIKSDVIDGKPFSTEFSFTRFLVPALCQWEGWALFCDSDFLFRADIKRLVEEFDNRYAVMVCKQTFLPSSPEKMDGQVQQKYLRKNWSSLMAFNCSHPSNKMLTAHAVNSEPGSWLHGFAWLTDAEIGPLTTRWNWLSGTTTGEPLAVHYSEGGPWFPGRGNVPYAAAWIEEAQRIGLWKEAA